MNLAGMKAIRAVLYIRPYSGDRATKAVAVHNQRTQLEDFCRKHGWHVVGEFVDTGGAVSGRRPAFGKMLTGLTKGALRCEKVVVHSNSRFARNEVEAELSIRALRRRGIEVASINQVVGHDGTRDLMRRVIMLFDEHSFRETSHHVKRSLRENARQGFWCGGTAPYGFRIVVASQPGETVKKKLELDPIEADVIRKMFDLLENGEGQSSPMGVKSITVWLNENGYRTRRGKNWSIVMVNRLLTNSVVKGDYIYGKRGGIETAIHVSVPEIIPAHRFDMAQKLLWVRNPKGKQTAISHPRINK